MSGNSDLVMVLLGFKVRHWRALTALFEIGRGSPAIRVAKPDGLLRMRSLCLAGIISVSGNLGIRQYWRDAKRFGRFTRDTPHAGWWRDFLRDTQGCGFRHEAYHARGWIEAIYVSMPERPGLGGFAPIRQPIGPFLSSQGRVKANAVARHR